MKKNLFAFAAACMIAACGAGSAQAQELDKDATQAEIAAFEKENFISFKELSADGEAKFSQNIIAATGEGAEGAEAKCWFWGWRYYYYPSYYYYTWYCPCYYVPLRLVTYTVPTTVVTAPAAAATTVVTTPTTAATTTTTTTAATTTDVSAVAIAKSTGVTACGAVVDQVVPSHSPLARMGIQRGDVITHIDGVQVRTDVDLKKITVNSKLQFIPGNRISVSKQQLNQVPGAAAAKALEDGAKELRELNIGEKSIEKNKIVSLYEYYEGLED